MQLIFKVESFPIFPTDDSWKGFFFFIACKPAVFCLPCSGFWILFLFILLLYHNAMIFLIQVSTVHSYVACTWSTLERFPDFFFLNIWKISLSFFILRVLKESHSHTHSGTLAQRNDCFPSDCHLNDSASI